MRTLAAAALAAWSALAFAQDAGRGRALYVQICALCHADPPGSGSVNPLVRAPDQIRAAMARVSPMRYLNDALTDGDLADIVAYFATVLGPPTHAPDFAVGGQWASPDEPWWVVYVTQYANRQLLTGGWLTFAGDGTPTWLYFYEGGGWTAPGVYTAKLYRNTGPAFGGPLAPGAMPPHATEAGTIAFVFSNATTADVTFLLPGASPVTHKLRRAAFPP